MVHCTPFAAVALLAVAVTGDSPMFAKMVVELGALGVLGWYCWYVTKTAIPKLTKDYREEQAATRGHYAEMMDRIIGEWGRTREQNHRDCLAMMTAISEMAAECRLARTVQPGEGG